VRRRFVQINGELVEITNESRPQVHQVIPEIEGYRSMVDGSWIDSRSKHREHLKRHNCVEVGNDSSLWAGPKGIPDVAPQQRKEIIRAQIDSMRHDDLKRMMKRDLDNLRWNSRKD